jgi:subtilisin-like proprotein convertase family protein
VRRWFRITNVRIQFQLVGTLLITLVALVFSPPVASARVRANSAEPPAAQLTLQSLQHNPDAILPSSDAHAELRLPTPDGSEITFKLQRTTVFAGTPDRSFPIHTFAGVGLDDRSASLRLDVSPWGLHAMILREGEAGGYIISGDTLTPLPATNWPSTLRCEVFADSHSDGAHADSSAGYAVSYAARGAAPLRTFRVAIGASAEFTTASGGPEAALAAIVSLVNQLNGIYERELGCRLVLVANQAGIIYQDALTDPYSADNPPAMLVQNQNALDAIIGAGNYDVGHALTATESPASFGGTSNLAVLCSASKARGVSVMRASPDLAADPLNLFILAHELGHQFGAEHTFNGDATSNCSLNRAAASAFEPGSGSTIMSYAGFCGPDNLAPIPDFYFHARSFEQIQAHAATRVCPVITTSTNTPPTLWVGPDITIPSRTPFMLTANVADADGDPILVRWEQFDLGPPRSLTESDDGLGPIMRSRPATLNNSRVFPALDAWLNSAPTPGELLPSVARTLRFHATAIDNRIAGSERTVAPLNVAVVASAGPFLVNSPAGGELWSGVRTILWNPALTDVAPINATTVRILLSLDGGLTFPHVLAANTANDGQEAIILPNVSTSRARVLIQPVGQAFFAVTAADFSIHPSPPVAFALLGEPTMVDRADAGRANGNGALDPGERAELHVTLANVGTDSASGTMGELKALSPTARIIQPAISFGDLAPAIASPGDGPFVIELAHDHPCGSPINLALTVRSAGGETIIPFSLNTGRPPTPSPEVAGTYAGMPIIIPDGTGSGVPGPAVEALVNINALVGPIARVRLRIDGSACSASSNSTTAGLSHNFVGDLTLTLISPSGTAIILADRPGSASNTGNNFCNTTFDDSALTSIQTITPAAAPYSDAYRPASPLAALLCENPNGTWRLRCRDMSSPDAGTLRAWSLLITTTLPAVCEPFCPCPADFNASGGTPDTADIDAFFNAWLVGEPAADTDCSGGTPDTQDIDAFFNAWLRGGC